MTRVVAAIKAAAATITDTLAALGEQMPSVSQATITAAGVTITVTPKPPEAPRTCPTCGGHRA